MYRIIEAANKLGVSKVTIYKKISLLKPDIKKYLIKDKNVTYLTLEGYELIKDSLKHSTAYNADTPKSAGPNHYEKSNSDIDVKVDKILESYLNDLIMQYDYLKTVVKNKNDRLQQIQLTTELLRRLCTNARNEGAGGHNGE